MKQDIYSRIQKKLYRTKIRRLKKNGNCGSWKMRQPDFPGSRGHMNSSNFFARRLDKHKTLFILFLPRLQLHESFLCFFFPPGPGNPGWKHAALISMQDAKLFSTRLTFFSTTSILFALSSAWLTLPSLFSLFLCFFAPATSLLSYFFPDMNLFSSNRCSVPLRIRFLLGNQAATLSMRSMD